MLWKIYVVIFAVINVASLLAFDYSDFDYFGFASLILSVGLNIAVFSYAFRKPILSRPVLDWLFKLNIVMFAVFFMFEFLAFLQELIGAGIKIPTSGVVSVIASFPSLPALYATYKMAYVKTPKAKKKSQKKA